MARIAGVNIPTNKRVVIALQYIHGIGSSKAHEITEKVGIPAERRVNQLTDQEVLQIRETIDRDYMVEGDLRREVTGFSGPLSLKQFKGGQSNPTYLLSADSGRYVLRAKPPGEHACVVCMGTACYINGATKLLDRIAEACGLIASGVRGARHVEIPEAELPALPGVVVAGLQAAEACDVTGPVAPVGGLDDRLVVQHQLVLEDGAVEGGLELEAGRRLLLPGWSRVESSFELRRGRTEVHFLPDESIFTNVDFHYDVLAKRLQKRRHAEGHQPIDTQGGDAAAQLRVAARAVTVP